MPNNPEQYSILTSWGEIRLQTSTDGLERCSLPFLKENPTSPFAMLEAGSDPYSRYVCDLLEGKHPNLPPIGRLNGTPFQVQVWQGLMRIPAGETRSYLNLAEEIGCARAVRAVANACGRNPASLFVPCHRVIRSDGNLGGFSSGLPWKRLLLAVEQLSR